ncbi:hypothetical protein MIDIC_30009 [Alphaproteobacteria bacterium]
MTVTDIGTSDVSEMIAKFVAVLEDRIDLVFEKGEGRRFEKLILAALKVGARTYQNCRSAKNFDYMAAAEYWSQNKNRIEAGIRCMQEVGVETGVIESMYSNINTLFKKT